MPRRHRVLAVHDYVAQPHGKLVEAEVTSLPASLVVVSGLRKDYLHVHRRGHVTVHSQLDKNLTLYSSAPRDKREYFTLQVRVGLGNSTGMGFPWKSHVNK